MLYLIPEKKTVKNLERKVNMAIRIGINGFGRIGRLAYRRIREVTAIPLKKANSQIRETNP